MATAIATLAGITLGLGVLGLYAVSRLRQDLMNDEDGKETLAQEILQFYFWLVGTIGVALEEPKPILRRRR